MTSSFLLIFFFVSMKVFFLFTITMIIHPFPFFLFFCEFIPLFCIFFFDPLVFVVVVSGTLLLLLLLLLPGIRRLMMIIVFHSYFELIDFKFWIEFFFQNKKKMMYNGKQKKKYFYHFRHLFTNFFPSSLPSV